MLSDKQIAEIALRFWDARVWSEDQPPGAVNRGLRFAHAVAAAALRDAAITFRENSDINVGSAVVAQHAAAHAKKARGR